MAYVVAIPVLIAWAVVVRLLSSDWPQIRGSLFFPLAGQHRQDLALQRQNLLSCLNGRTMKLTTADGRHVDAVWACAPGNSPDSCTVILFHANAMVLDDMGEWGLWYLRNGVNVMLVTLH